jgi:hypothetical protein
MSYTTGIISVARDFFVQEATLVSLSARDSSKKSTHFASTV